MEKKYTKSEFDEKFKIFYEGPKTIHSGTISVRFNVFELLIKDIISGQEITTGLILEELNEHSFDIVYQKYCSV